MSPLPCQTVLAPDGPLQPTLQAFSATAAPHYVPLDTSALKPEHVLLLDTFFEIVVHHGQTVVAWKSGSKDDDHRGAALRQAVLSTLDFCVFLSRTSNNGAEL